MSAPAALVGVSKSYGDVVALVDVSYEAAEGEILAVLGPNGAGKTTSLSLLLGLHRPDAGIARIFGRDPRHPAARRLIGMTPQEMAFPATLRVREVIEFVRAHYPRPADTASLLERFGLEALTARQTGGLSGGERRRLAVALAFAGAPDLVVLDEPTTGLDIDARQAVWTGLRDYVEGGGAALLTTHHLEEAEALADAIIVISAGRVVAHGSVAEIRRGAGRVRVSFLAEPLPEGVLPARVVIEMGRVVLDAAEPVELLRRLIQAGARLADLEVRPLPLEEVLLALPEDPE